MCLLAGTQRNIGSTGLLADIIDIGGLPGNMQCGGLVRHRLTRSGFPGLLGFRVFHQDVSANTLTDSLPSGALMRVSR